MLRAGHEAKNISSQTDSELRKHPNSEYRKDKSTDEKVLDLTQIGLRKNY